MHFNQNPFLIIGICFILFSILFYHKEKRQLALVLLILGSLGLGFFMATLDPFLQIWDEQFHALVAKNLIDNPLKPVLYKKTLLDFGYENWTLNHIWLHKQPLFLWQMALSLKTFGLNELAVRLPSVLLHAIIPLFIYRIGSISVNKNVGFYGALFFTVAYFPLELIAGKFMTDHNDVSFLFYVTASFWAWFEYQLSKNNKWLILIGLFSGCAVLVKWLVGLLIYSVWTISIGADDRKKWLMWKSYLPIFKSFIVSLLVFVPWQLYISYSYPIESQHEYALNTKHFLEVIEGHGGTIWFHYDAIQFLFGIGVLVPVILLIGIYLFAKQSISKIYSVVIVSSVLIIYLFYSIASTKMVSFCIVISPIIFLGLGAMVDKFLTILTKKRFFISSIILIIICNFLIRLPKIEANHTNIDIEYYMNFQSKTTNMKMIHKLKATLGEKNFVVFNTNEMRDFCAVPVMFYTNYCAYDFIPNEKQLADIQKKGVSIAILDNGKLPSYILNQKDIIKIGLIPN